jgi:pSer/pThr/pTyr-binding forkhead associated (FHA) protein/PAS domain-containing protein
VSCLAWLNTENCDEVAEALSAISAPLAPTAREDDAEHDASANPHASERRDPEARQAFRRVFIRTAGSTSLSDDSSDDSGKFALVVDFCRATDGVVVQQPISHAIGEAIPAGLCVLHPDGTIVFWSNALTSLVGLDSYEMVGLDAFEDLLGSPQHALQKPRSLPHAGEFSLPGRGDADARKFSFTLLDWGSSDGDEAVAAGQGTLLCVVSKARSSAQRNSNFLAAMGRAISDFNSHASDFRVTRVERMQRFCDTVVNLVSQMAAVEKQLTPNGGAKQDEAGDAFIAAASTGSDALDMAPPRQESHVRLPSDVPPAAWGHLASQDTNVCSSCYITTPIGKEFRAGRSSQCHVVVRDAFVSSQQFTLIRRTSPHHGKEPIVILLDQSANGTFVNIKRVGRDKQVVLQPGDLINFRLSTAQFFLGFVFAAANSKQPAGAAPGGARAAPAGGIAPAKLEWRIGEEMLGKGGNAEVFLGLNLSNGKLIAVKRVPIPKDQRTRKQYQSLQEEMSVLSTAAHANIVRYYGTAQDAHHLSILLEFVPGGSIRHLLNNFGPLGDAIILRYLHQMLLGLRYLHGRSIVHGDLKCANVLVTDKGEVKLTDFGTAKVIKTAHIGGETATSAEAVTVHGTLLWMAPETIRGRPPSFASDIWSVGCCIIEMLNAEFPWYEYDFESEEQMANLLKYTQDPPEVPQTSHAVVRAIADACLNLDAGARPTVEQLLHMMGSVADRGNSRKELPAAAGGSGDLLDEVAKARMALM